MFSINFNSYWEEEVDLEIMRNDRVLVRAWAGKVDGLYNHGSAFTITECNTNDVIRPRTSVAPSVMTGSPLSHFSGYMLNQYA